MAATDLKTERTLLMSVGYGQMRILAKQLLVSDGSSFPLLGAHAVKAATATAYHNSISYKL